MAAQRSPSPLLRAMSRRWTWIALFLLVHALLLSIRTWHNSAAAAAGWKALYAFVLYGGVFGLLSMGVALAVAVPATVITWITILVLLAFFGKSRQELLAESHRIIADITGFVFKFFHRRRHQLPRSRPPT